MPYSITMRRAIVVAFSMSLAGAGGGIGVDDLLGGPAAQQQASWSTSSLRA
jgi:hypothetical protein